MGRQVVVVFGGHYDFGLSAPARFGGGRFRAAERFIFQRAAFAWECRIERHDRHVAFGPIKLSAVTQTPGRASAASVYCYALAVAAFAVFFDFCQRFAGDRCRYAPDVWPLFGI